MSLINKMLNELEKNKKSEETEVLRTKALSGLTATIKKQKGAFRWKLIIWAIILAAITWTIWLYHPKIVSNFSKSYELIKTKAVHKKTKVIKPSKETVIPVQASIPKPEAIITEPVVKSTTKLKEIQLTQQDNQTILDFVLSAPVTYYVEHSQNKQQLFINFDETGLSGNLPVILENSFLMALDAKQNKKSTTITLSLLPGTKTDTIELIRLPKPFLRLTFSNPQLSNSSMSKTPAPLSREEQEIRRLKEIQNLLSLNKIHNATHKLHLFIGDFPDNLQARTILVSLLLKEKKAKKANEILAIGLKRYANYIPFIKLKARILAKQHKLPVAIKILEKHMASTDDIELLALLAALYQQQKKYMPAANIYNRLTKIEPQNGTWWLGLGMSLENAGKTNAAKEAYQKAYNSPNISPEITSLLNEKVR